MNISCEKISFVVTSIAACNENRLGRHDERQSNFLKHRGETNDQHFGKRMNYYCYRHMCKRLRMHSANHVCFDRDSWLLFKNKESWQSIKAKIADKSSNTPGDQKTKWTHIIWGCQSNTSTSLLLWRVASLTRQKKIRGHRSLFDLKYFWPIKFFFSKKTENGEQRMKSWGIWGRSKGFCRKRKVGEESIVKMKQQNDWQLQNFIFQNIVWICCTSFST